jgi:hypothetical protein
MVYEKIAVSKHQTLVKQKFETSQKPYFLIYIISLSLFIFLFKDVIIPYFIDAILLFFL